MILASLKPYYYYLIGEKKKNIEVRKSALKDLSQDIVFYMSKDEKSFAKIPKEFQEKYRKHFGKVGIRAVVDKICPMKMTITAYGDLILLSKIGMICNYNICLSNDELYAYLGGKMGYGWNLDSVAIYDKPKELSEFRISCNRKNLCYSCNRFTGKPWDICNNSITRPPQSYMRVEELKECKMCDLYDDILDCPHGDCETCTYVQDLGE